MAGSHERGHVARGPMARHHMARGHVFYCCDCIGFITSHSGSGRGACLTDLIIGRLVALGSF